MGAKKKYRVVYSTEFGYGFGLSEKAVKWLEENATDKELLEFIAEARKKAEKADKLWSTNEDLIQYDIVHKFKGKGIPRHHKDLVAMVEALRKKASGKFSDISIAKIKGPIYRIEEYDGSESVLEPEDYEWVTIEDDEKE